MALEGLAESFSGQLSLAACAMVAACLLAPRAHATRLLPARVDPSAAVLAAGAALAIAAVTVTPRGGVVSRGTVQLVPFHTIRGYRWASWQDLLIYAGGNVALFVPLGFFLYLSLRELLPTAAIAAAIAAGSALSLAVEIAQLAIWTRSTDVDDLILNTLGGAIGVVAAAIGSAARRHGTGASAS